MLKSENKFSKYEAGHEEEQNIQDCMHYVNFLIMNNSSAKHQLPISTELIKLSQPKSEIVGEVIKIVSKNKSFFVSRVEQDIQRQSLARKLNYDSPAIFFNQGRSKIQKIKVKENTIRTSKFHELQSNRSEKQRQWDERHPREIQLKHENQRNELQKQPSMIKIEDRQSNPSIDEASLKQKQQSERDRDSVTEKYEADQRYNLLSKQSKSKSRTKINKKKETTLGSFKKQNLFPISNSERTNKQQLKIKQRAGQQGKMSWRDDLGERKIGGNVKRCEQNGLKEKKVKAIQADSPIEDYEESIDRFQQQFDQLERKQFYNHTQTLEIQPVSLTNIQKSHASSHSQPNHQNRHPKDLIFQLKLKNQEDFLKKQNNQSLSARKSSEKSGRRKIFQNFPSNLNKKQNQTRISKQLLKQQPSLNEDDAEQYTQDQIKLLVPALGNKYKELIMETYIKEMRSRQKN